MGCVKMIVGAVIIIGYLFGDDMGGGEGAVVVVEQQLEVGFYKNSCPKAELIVADEVRISFFHDPGIAPGIIRLFFHDCFVRGCDASVLIDSTKEHGNGSSSEKEAPVNGNTARGFEVIDRAKARVEAVCKGVVSCADILAFAARDAFILTHGGLGWKVPSGRRDGLTSLAQDTSDIPSPQDNLDQITAAFAKKGLSQHEMIALLGAHTIGQSHCTSFSNRLYNFSSNTKQDPSLHPLMAHVLKMKCPLSSEHQETEVVDPNLVVQMNSSPLLSDNSYYRDILAHKVLFTSDQTLASSLFSLPQVYFYAHNYWKWKADFVLAMIKMGQIEVLTGTAGEIRANCRVVNNPHH